MLPLKELRSKPGHLLWRAQQLGWQLFADEVGDLNITPVQEVVLLTLQKRPNIDQKTLAQLVALDRSTTSDVVTRLEQRGFLSKVPHKNDKRAWSLALTASGNDCAESLVPVARKVANRLLAALSPRERDELIRILRKVVGLADQVDLQETSGFQKDRLAEKSIITIGSGSLNSGLLSRLTSEGARVVNIPWSADCADDSAKSTERELKRATRARRPDAIIVAGNDKLRIPASFEDNATIKTEIDLRLSMLNAILKLYANGEYLRVVNICLFPSTSTKLDDAAPNDMLALNSAFIAMTQRYHVPSAALGISLMSIAPRVFTIIGAAASGITNHYAQVLEEDVASCVAFLISSEARAIAGSYLELGVGH